jgi:AcrR family transcriptional regulator
MRKARKTSYHHGRLREALIEAALGLVKQQGALALSLREVARQAGVSHAAPAHHFGDKAGLLTAIAIEGFTRFTEAQRQGAARGGDDPQRRFRWLGWAYVMFAAEHRAYFEVMFRPELLRRDDPDLQRVALGAYQVLLEGVREALDPTVTPDELALHATTSWAEAHGLATLWLDGNLTQYAGLSDLDGLTRKVFGLPPA